LHASVLHVLRRFLWVWQVALPGIARIRHELVMQPVAVNILAGVASFLLSWACLSSPRISPCF
jgi:hypothetical protein